MSGLSIYGREQSMLALWIPEQLTIPTTLWVALCLSVPMAGDDGTDLEEPVDPTYYARQEYGRGEAWWTMTGRGTVENTVEVVFGPSLTVDWGLINGWALCTAATAGEIVEFGEVTNPYRVIHGPEATVTIGVGTMSMVQI